MHDGVELNFEDIQKEPDPYQLFLNSIRSPDAKRKYKNELGRFLKLVPSKFYEEALGDYPKSNEVNILAQYFVKLAKKNQEVVGRIIAAYVKEEIELVRQGTMSANTLPNHIKPIKTLLDTNGIAIHWKTIHKMYPRAKPEADDRAYNKEELQRMIEVANDITDKIIILMSSSGGFRLEAWNYFTWKDIVFFKNNDGSYKGAALQVYRGDPESYSTFLTPECCNSLATYREVWKSKTGAYPRQDDPLLKAVKFQNIRKLNAFGVKRRLDKIVRKIGLRNHLAPGKKRYEVQLAHGFRKYFHTMLRRAKVNYADMEDMMGHEVGLEKHYERYNEEDFERFPEYAKAIPFLTISDEERLRIENKRLEAEKSEIEEMKQKQAYLETELEKVIQWRETTKKYEVNDNRYQQT